MKTRRQFSRDLLRGLYVTAAGIPVSCASVVGAQTIEGWFQVGKNGASRFAGWTEVELDQEVGPDDAAAIVHASLQAPAAAGDLRFLQEVTCEAVIPSKRTLLMRGSNFPKGDTIGPLEVVYKENLRPFFPDGKKIRVEWRGSIDTTFAFPADGFRIDALVTIELL